VGPPQSGGPVQSHWKYFWIHLGNTAHYRRVSRATKGDHKFSPFFTVFRLPLTFCYFPESFPLNNLLQLPLPVLTPIHLSTFWTTPVFISPIRRPYPIATSLRPGYVFWLGGMQVNLPPPQDSSGNFACDVESGSCLKIGSGLDKYALPRVVDPVPIFWFRLEVKVEWIQVDLRSSSRTSSKN